MAVLATRMASMGKTTYKEKILRPLPNSREWAILT
jgi:hypothetical protein